ncbi:glycoside hydrolase family 2 protein [Bacteroidota bacterium]
MKSIKIPGIIPILLMMITASANAQPGIVSEQIENSKLERDLSGGWKFKRMNPGQGVKEGIHELPPGDIETLTWARAKIPGDVYTDLWNAGAIDDPYFGRNTARAQWVMHQEWWYSRQFSINDDLKDKVIMLEFDGVDYSCEVWLNGVHLGGHKGAFSPFSFDITEHVHSSENQLRSVNMIMIKLDPPPQVNASVAGTKTPWFGDYWVDLIPFGIWKPIRIKASGAVRMDNLYTHAEVNDDGSANVIVEVTLENTGTSPRDMTMYSSIQGKNFESDELKSEITRTVNPGKQIITETIYVKNPKLWMPWDLGKPNLYLAKVSVTEGEDLHDFSETSFGIRDLKMAWNPGFTKDEVSFPRTVMLNGKVHYIRSACWGGPPDIFVGRTSVDEYKELIRLAKEANMNNIRIFGWHPPEIPEFYELCNEAGLTVWQDVIPLGTANIPKDRAFLENIYEEAVAVIKEIRNNPCLILIEGGEEAFLRASDPEFTKSFLLELGDTLQQYVDLPYVPDSPLTNGPALEAGYKPKESVHALAYFYGMGNWLMEDWFLPLDYPIVPELAITSIPNVESLKKFIPEDELWPPGVSWDHHWADFRRFSMQNFDAFGEERNGSLQELVDATQDSQGMIFQLSIEHFRRSKPRGSGVAICHFITYWPDMKWAIVDNYQQPKRSFYFVQRAYQPLLVNLKFERRRWKNDENFKGELWVVNDLYEDFGGCKIKMRIIDKEGKKLLAETYNIEDVERNSSKMFVEFDEDILEEVEGSFNVELMLLDRGGDLVSSNTYLFLIGDQEEATKHMKELSRRR